MEDLKKLKEILDAPIETRILPQKNFPYVPISALRERLNVAFDCLWDIEILSSEIVENNVLLHGKLIGHIGDKKICKQAYGSALIQRFNSGNNKGQPTNIGDAYNNALYDFLKCASKLMCISNKEMDVKKDPRTGKYVQVGNTPLPTASDTTDKTESKPEPQNENKLNELKKKIEANKSKSKVTEIKPELKEPVIEKEDDVPMPEGSSTKKQEKAPEKPNTDAIQKTKLLELKKKLAANKNKTNGNNITTKPEIKTETKPEATEPKTEPVKEEVAEGDYGFDYSDVGSANSETPKNTQKLVILNLAKMQKLTVEDYIKKALGKEKAIDNLTADEAGRVVRSGLSKFD